MVAWGVPKLINQAAVGLVNALTRFEDFVMCLKKLPFSKTKTKPSGFFKSFPRRIRCAPSWTEIGLNRRRERSVAFLEHRHAEAAPHIPRC